MLGQAGGSFGRAGILRSAPGHRSLLSLLCKMFPFRSTRQTLASLGSERKGLKVMGGSMYSISHMEEPGSSKKTKQKNIWNNVLALKIRSIKRRNIFHPFRETSPGKNECLDCQKYAGIDIPQIINSLNISFFLCLSLIAFSFGIMLPEYPKSILYCMKAKEVFFKKNQFRWRTNKSTIPINISYIIKIVEVYPLRVIKCQANG